MTITALSSGDLRTECDQSLLGFETTAGLPEVSIGLGQERAVQALQFGLRIDADGYNAFALGPSGIGKMTTVRELIYQESGRSEAPSDWCYVHNFSAPHQPVAICLPAGEGTWLRNQMQMLVDNLQLSIPAAFESEDYRNQAEALNEALRERQKEATEKVGEQARQQNIALLHTPNGFAFAPSNDNGEVITPEQFQKLPEPERKAIEEKVARLQAELQRALRQLPQWIKETREKMTGVNREIAASVVGQLIAELKEHFAAHEELLGYLNTVEADVIENFDAFIPRQEGGFQFMARPTPEATLQRYAVNLLVDNSGAGSAPVVYEDLPSFSNLMGRTEYQAQMGTLVTDFTLIRAGALHRANGGFLILDARQVLMQPLAWDGLKRALQAREIRLDSLERTLSVISTVSLEPEHIPLSIKVILLGDRQLYYLLSQFDPDFNDLFKVMADFDEVMDRSLSSDALYARLFGSLLQKHQLREMDNAAVARLIEHTSRLAGDAGKISTNLGAIVDLLRESNHWCGESGRQVIGREDVQMAIDQHAERASRVRYRIYERIKDGTIMIDVSGQAVGQINGLSVLQMGQFSFGQPSRITATTRLGDGKIIDIERETKLGGPIHTKGVFILSSLLAARYSRDQPLSMAASLVFEQSYGRVDGDSASLAELCALLSSLAGVPIQQRFAVTGSVNQFGQVQPIGGVNEKIEGFFDVCSQAGLSGEQAVIIPQSNVRHLMLRTDVVQAVRDNRFNVYAVQTVDQAIELLTGLTAGERDGNNRFEPDSLNGKVQDRLSALSTLRRQLSAERTGPADDKPGEPVESDPDEAPDGPQ